MSKACAVVLCIGLMFGTSCSTVAGLPPVTTTKTSSQGNSWQRLHVVVAMDATFPPMEFRDDNTGDVSGFTVDLLREIAKVVNLDLEFRIVSWDGLFSGLLQNEYDLVASSVIINESRKTMVSFSKPYLNAGQVIVVKESTSTHLAKLAALDNQRVGALINSEGSALVGLHPKVTLAAYEDVSLAFRGLIEGETAAVVTDLATAANFTRIEEFKGRVKIVMPPVSNEFFGFVVKPGKTELLKRLNTAIETLDSDGRLDELVKKWIR